MSNTTNAFKTFLSELLAGDAFQGDGNVGNASRVDGIVKSVNPTSAIKEIGASLSDKVSRRFHLYLSDEEGIALINDAYRSGLINDKDITDAGLNDPREMTEEEAELTKTYQVASKVIKDKTQLAALVKAIISGQSDEEAGKARVETQFHRLVKLVLLKSSSLPIAQGMFKAKLWRLNKVPVRKDAATKLALEKLANANAKFA